MARQDGIKPCSCGSEDLIVWHPEEPNDDNMMGLLSLEKIECNECSNVVYGCDDEAIDDWNNHRYD